MERQVQSGRDARGSTAKRTRRNVAAGVLAANRARDDHCSRRTGRRREGAGRSIPSPKTQALSSDNEKLLNQSAENSYDRCLEIQTQQLGRWFADHRSEERRVGKERRSRWSPYH